MARISVSELSSADLNIGFAADTQVVYMRAVDHQPDDSTHADHDEMGYAPSGVEDSVVMQETPASEAGLGAGAIVSGDALRLHDTVHSGDLTNSGRAGELRQLGKGILLTSGIALYRRYMEDDYAIRTAVASGILSSLLVDARVQRAKLENSILRRLNLIER